MRRSVQVRERALYAGRERAALSGGESGDEVRPRAAPVVDAAVRDAEEHRGARAVAQRALPALR